MQSKSADFREPLDFAPAAKKAAQAAAIAASDMTHSAKADAQLSVLEFPRSGEMARLSTLESLPSLS